MRKSTTRLVQALALLFLVYQFTRTGLRPPTADPVRILGFIETLFAGALILILERGIEPPPPAPPPASPSEEGETARPPVDPLRCDPELSRTIAARIRDDRRRALLFALLAFPFTVLAVLKESGPLFLPGWAGQMIGFALYSRAKGLHPATGLAFGPLTYVMRKRCRTRTTASATECPRCHAPV